MLYIILPTYNEKENILDLLKAIFSLPIADLKVLVIDDNSPDGTAEIVKQMQPQYNLGLIERPGKLGLGSAYVMGFKKALAEGAKFIMEMDADFSHQPSDIPRLLAAVEGGVDLAIGSRRVRGGKIIGWNWWRLFMSWGAMTFSRFVLGLKTKDVTAGFRCYRREILEQIPLNEIKSNGYSFQEEMLFLVEKSGAKIEEVPVVFNDRQKGKSKLSKKDIIDFFLIVFKLKWKYAKRNN